MLPLLANNRHFGTNVITSDLLKRNKCMSQIQMDRAKCSTIEVSLENINKTSQHEGMFSLYSAVIDIVRPKKSAKAAVGIKV